MESTFRPALVLMSGRALAFAGTFFVPIVLVRIFDQAEFGTYKQLFLIFSTFYAIAQFGMAESLYFFLPVAARETGRYVVNSLLCLAAAGLVFLGLISAAGPRISQWLSNPELLRYLPLVGVFLLLALISAGFEMVMISRKKYLWASFSYGLSDLLRAACFLVPALLLRSLEWVLAGAIGFALFRLCVALFYYRREFPGELRPDGALLKKQLAYALPFGMAVIVEILQANFPHYAVSHRFDAATFAIYSVGCLQIPLVDFVAGPAANVMMVRMSEQVKEGRSSAVLELWHDTTRKLALLFFPLFALVLVSARELMVLLFTGSYLASVPIFMVCSVTLPLAILQVDSVLRVYAQTRFIFLLNAVRLLLIVALIHWFLSSFHLLGAVLLTILALAAGKAMALVRMRRLLKVDLAELLPWRALTAILTAAAAAGLAALFVKAEVGLSPFFLLLATGASYAASYGALLLVFGLLTESEKAALTGWLQRPPLGAAKV